MDRIIIVSCDGHVSAPVEVYASYLESKYHDQLWRLSRENEQYVDYFGEFGRPTDGELEIFDTRGRLRGGAEFGTWNAQRRLAELDADGIAAEFLLWGTQYNTTPFFAVGNRPYAPDVRAAGARAWNRMIADMTAQSHGRLLGVAEPGPCHDLDATIAELHWAVEHGFPTVTVPGSPADPDLPPLHDAHFEPFWSACDDLGLALSIHAGWGAPQGSMHAFIDAARASAREMSVMDMQKQILSIDLGPRSVFWRLMLGGVFDRHPGLHLALTEIRADWVPATLAHLDARLVPGEAPITMRPSEYFARNCVVVPSNIHRAEVEMRHDIGIGNLLFGADYPHFESTWPNTFDWIRDAFAGVNEPDARAILGENAIRVFGLDRRTLVGVANRIGPRVDEVLGRDFSIDPQLVSHFDKRAGYLRGPEEHDTHALDALLDQDLEAVGALAH
jgi:predicted TIM-barrel fold metal-dependent hydrolase